VGSVTRTSCSDFGMIDYSSLKALQPLKQLFSGRFFYLLIFLLSMFLIYPFQNDDNTIGALILQVLYFAILLSSLRAVSRDRPVLRKILIVLLVTSGIAHAVDFLNHMPWLYLFGLWNNLIFYCLVVFAILAYVFQSGRVDHDKIIGAICVYIFMGVVFTHLYLLLQFYAPHSFSIGAVQANGAAVSTKVAEDALFYFSFITLTTVGFGDITPISGRSGGLFFSPRSTKRADLFNRSRRSARWYAALQSAPGLTPGCHADF